MKVAGAYKVTHVPTGFFYIGHTGDFVKRKTRHVSDLNCGRSFITKLAEVYKPGDELEWVLYPAQHKARALVIERHLISLNQDSPLICNKFNAGFTISNDHRQIISQYAKNRVMSDETKSKISMAKLGSTHTPESKERISIARRGYKHTEETKARMSMSKASNPLSQEMRDKISLARSKPVTLDGVTYTSVNAAASALGVSRQVIHYRIKQNK